MVIDLNATTQVDRVRVWQRGDCCAERLQNFTRRPCWPTTAPVCRVRPCGRRTIPGRFPPPRRADFDFTPAHAQTLTKTGTGTLTLNGNNSYLGQTRVNQGTLIAGHNNALGGAGGLGTTVAIGATLALQGGITLPAGEAIALGSGGSGTATLKNLSGDNHVAGPIQLNFNDARIQSDANTLYLDGPITPVQGALYFDGAANTVVNGSIAAQSLAGRFVRVRNNGTASRSLAISEIEAFGAGVIPDSVTGVEQQRDRRSLVRVVRGRGRPRRAGQPGQ